MTENQYAASKWFCKDSDAHELTRNFTYFAYLYYTKFPHVKLFSSYIGKTKNCGLKRLFQNKTYNFQKNI